MVKVYSLVGTLMEMGACAPATLWVLRFHDARTALAAIRLRNDKHVEWLDWLVWHLSTPEERIAFRDRCDDYAMHGHPRTLARAVSLSHDQIIARLRAVNVTVHPSRREIADYLDYRLCQLNLRERREARRMFPEFPELFL